MMLLGSAVLLCLLAVIQKVYTGDSDYKCSQLSQPPNCTDNPKIRISKSRQSYRLILCSDNQCSDNTTISFECKHICDGCKQLQIQECRPHRDCERKMDSHFNSHCFNIMLATKLTTSMPSTVASQGDLQFTPAESCVNITAPGSTVALGVLFLLSVVLLAMVITGWAATWWIMKRREAKWSTATFIKGSSANEEEVHQNNPACDVTTASLSRGNPRAPAAVHYHVLEDTPASEAMSGNRQAYHVLKRGQAIGQTRATARDSSEGASQSYNGDGKYYSQLGPRDEQLNK